MAAWGGPSQRDMAGPGTGDKDIKSRASQPMGRESSIDGGVEVGDIS